MDDQSIEKIEIDLFLEAVYQRYGYDFRHDALASMRRRVRHLLARTSGATVAVVQDPATAEAERMPLAALATTQADYVLAPLDIGRLLVELGADGEKER